jgi:hypothetical protein
MTSRRRTALLLSLSVAALLCASMLAPAFGAPRAVSAASLAKKLAKTTKIAKRADKNAKRALRNAKPGPAGPAGPKGDRGAPGAPGAPGQPALSGGAASSPGVPIVWTGSEQTVRSVSLPAGKYVFNATAFGNNDDQDDEQSFGCRIVAGTVNIAQNAALILAPQTGGLDHAASRGQYALTTGTTLTAPTTEVSLRCTASSADGMWQGVGLSAVRIG